MTFRDDDVAATLRAEDVREELAAANATLQQLATEAAELDARLVSVRRALRIGILRRAAAFAAIGLALGVVVSVRIGGLDALLVRAPGLRRALDARPPPQDGEAIQFVRADGMLCQVDFIDADFGRCHAPFACGGGRIASGDDPVFCAERGDLIEVLDHDFALVYSRRVGRGYYVTSGYAMELRGR